MIRYFGLKPSEDYSQTGYAQHSYFEVAFLAPWKDQVTKRKRTWETQVGLCLVRDKAIAYLMLYAEPHVERLNLEDVELCSRSGVLHITQGKGFRERDVPLLLAARKTLHA